MERISKHISFYEATKSSTAIRHGIENTPTPEHLSNMVLVAENVFEKVRTFVGRPLAVNSFYRSPDVNALISGSSSTSQHCNGMAIDIDGDPYEVDNRIVFDYIRNECDFDQLIWEYGNETSPAWVHVSFNKNGNRKQVLQKFKGKKYEVFNLY